jgi:hypothetical protein
LTGDVQLRAERDEAVVLGLNDRGELADHYLLRLEPDGIYQSVVGEPMPAGTGSARDDR